MQVKALVGLEQFEVENSRTAMTFLSDLVWLTVGADLYTQILNLKSVLNEHIRNQSNLII